jgi:hypothetical protein
MKPRYRGMVHCIYKIATEEGVMNLTRGLWPGVQRQFVNCAVRLGAYEGVIIPISSNDPIDKKSYLP